MKTKPNTKWLDKIDPDEPLPIRPKTAQVGNIPYQIVPDVKYSAPRTLAKILLTAIAIFAFVCIFVYIVL